MARIADVRDEELRGALEAIETLIDDGDYSAAARRSVETYLRIVEKRPDFIPPPPNPAGAPQFTDTLPANRSRGGGGSGGAGRTGWPNQGGIRVVFGPDLKPEVLFDKQRFSMSEAVYYFEFTMDEALRAQDS